MSVNGYVFPQFFLGVASGVFNFSSDTFKIALSDAAGPVTPGTSGVDTAKLFTDWTSNVAAEITGTGYTAGGVAVSSPTLTAGGTDNSVATFTSTTNPSWTGATFSANQAILYDDTADTYQLVAFWDFGGAVSVTDGTFTLTINSDGLFTATTST